MYIKEGFIKEKAEINGEIEVGEWGLHGDVVIKRVKDLPDDFDNMTTEPKNCLAYGEATGHAHQLQEGEFELKIDPANPKKRYLKIVKPTALRHHEHKEVTLFPGNYKISIQKNYDPFAKKIGDVVD